MDDLIRRQDVLDKAYELDLSDTGNDIQIMVVDVEDIEALPSVNVKPVVKGKWISENHPVYGDEYCMCSVCKSTRWKWHTVENLKSCPDCHAEMESGWIPCSERLPKIEQDVLIWTKDNTYEIAHLDIMEWTEDELVWYPQYNRLGDEVEWEIEEVTAWMPLPDAYKEGDN